jgi:hypothetical protein
MTIRSAIFPLLVLATLATFAPHAFAQALNPGPNYPSNNPPITSFPGNNPPTTSFPGNTSCPGNSGSSASGLTNPLQAQCLSQFLTSLLQLIVPIGTIVIVLMMVYIGFLFVTAQGEPGKIEKARAALLWTVLGALILLGAQAIAIGLQNTAQSFSNGSAPATGGL